MNEHKESNSNHVINPLRAQADVICACCGKDTAKQLMFVNEYAVKLRAIIDDFEAHFEEKLHRRATSDDLIYVLSQEVHYNVRNFIYR
jgi:hypothetical protein